MTEYLEKTKVMRILERILECLQNEGDKYGAAAVDSLLFEIGELPAADVAPVRHGRWTRIDYHDARCSECGHKTYYPDRISLYCPECGARMDGGADQ